MPSDAKYGDHFLQGDFSLLILPQRAGKAGTPVGMAFPLR
jgi:hypothetical protein